MGGEGPGAATAPAASVAAARSGHPSLDIVSASGTQLEGRRIVLCISGSVAAYKAIELARLLMRHGSGSVTCVASRAATRLIRPAYLKWATGNDVITGLTGGLEHIRLADYGRSDIVVVYPATANTIGKLANGMDDAPVSTVLAVAFGAKIPIVVCPAMHESMYGNPAVARNIEFLKKRRGIAFVGPQMVEGKAKAPEPEHVLDYVIARFGTKESPLRGRRVLLAAGPTVEYIDPVRMITNRSSGATGVLLASELLSAGAQVTMIYGPGTREPPKRAAVTRIETSSQMRGAVLGALKKTGFDVVVMAAAVSDFTPASPPRRTKIKSDAPTHAVMLKRVPKIISAARRAMPKGSILVGFKAEANVSRAALARSARASMTRHGADIMVANDMGERYQRNPIMNNAIILTPSSETETGWRKKEAIARIIRGAIEKEITRAHGRRAAAATASTAAARAETRRRP